MPVESASDLAGMFDTAEFAEAARYTPPGGVAATDCVVIVDRGQGRRTFDAGSREIEGSERRLWAQAAEITVVARGGTFALVDDDGNATGEAFTVAGEPKLDQLASLWSADLLIVD